MVDAIEAKMDPIYEQFKEYLSRPEDREFLGKFAEIAVLFEREATEEELKDILGFFHHCKMQEELPSPICATIGHDMGGIAGRLLCFSPISKGYAKYLPL